MERQDATIVSMAIALANSPCFSPPIPSETTHKFYFLSHSEGVFIVLPYPAYVGLGSDFNAEMAAVVHANSLSCILYSIPVVSARRQRSMPGL